MMVQPSISWETDISSIPSIEALSFKSSLSLEIEGSNSVNSFGAHQELYVIDTNIEELFPKLKLTEADVEFSIEVVKGPIDKVGSVYNNSDTDELAEDTWDDSVVIYGTLEGHNPGVDASKFGNVIIPNAFRPDLLV